MMKRLSHIAGQPLLVACVIGTANLLSVSPVLAESISVATACVAPLSGCKYQDFQVTDSSRPVSGTPSQSGLAGRPITYRVYWKAGANAPAGGFPMIVISHGGRGNETGHTTFTHLAQEYTSHDYVTVHINHRLSVPDDDYHLGYDRPTDVSFMLNKIFADMANNLPIGLNGKINSDQIGGVGHSNGGYTMMALANGLYYQNGAFQTVNTVNPPSVNNSAYRDPRFKAMTILSPQGTCQHGSWALSPTSGSPALRTPPTTNCSSPAPTSDPKGIHNTWSKISIPMLNIVGECELDGEVGIYVGCSPLLKTRAQYQPGWRLSAFDQYNAGAGGYDRFEAILPGAIHQALGGEGTASDDAYTAQNSRIFFDVFLRQFSATVGENCDSPNGNTRLGCIGYMTGTGPLGNVIRRK